jgi:hypothetical protein
MIAEWFHALKGPLVDGHSLPLGRLPGHHAVHTVGRKLPDFD